MQRLDQSLLAFTGYRLRRTTSVAMSNMNTVFAKFGLRRTTFSTLALVVNNPGLRQSRLAEALAIERPNFVQIVGELEKAGLVKRKTAADDKRAYALHATKAGQALFEQAAMAACDCDQQLIQGLSSDQIAALHQALQIIETNAKCSAASDEP